MFYCVTGGRCAVRWWKMAGNFVYCLVDLISVAFHQLLLKVFDLENDDYRNVLVIMGRVMLTKIMVICRCEQFKLMGR